MKEADDDRNNYSNRRTSRGKPQLGAPRPTLQLINSLTELLSPSQVRCFMDCQIRWWFKYGLKIPDEPTVNIALGKAVHSALNENFAQKVDTREDLPTPGVVALFREAWIIRGLSRRPKIRVGQN